MRKLFIIGFIVFAQTIQAVEFEKSTIVNASIQHLGLPQKFAQTFTIGTVGPNINFLLTSIEISAGISIDGAAVYLELYNTSGGFPTGSPISYGTIAANNAIVWHQAGMSSVTLYNSTTYALVVYANGSASFGVNYPDVILNNPYAGGTMLAFNGSSWSQLTQYDLAFVINGETNLDPGNIAYNHYICENGDPSAFLNVSGASGGTGIITYTWQYSTTSNVPGQGTWYNLPSSNVTSYDLSSLAVTTNFTRRAQDSYSTAYSNVVTVTVAPQFTPGVIAGSQTYCHSSNVSAFTSTSGASGGVSYPNYQWQYSTTSSVAGQGTWYNITGATSATYDPGILENTTYFVRRATDAVCGITYSNVITITIRAQLLGGTVGSNQELPEGGGDVAAFTSSSSASGGSGSYTYTWQYSTSSNVGGSGAWSDISSSNSTTYNYGTVTEKTFFVRKAVDASCGTVYSNVITVSIEVPPPSSSCEGVHVWPLNNSYADIVGSVTLINKNSQEFSTTKKEGSHSLLLNSTNARAITNTTIDNTGAYSFVATVFHYNTSGTFTLFSNRRASDGKGIEAALDAANLRIRVTMDGGSTLDYAYTANSSVPTGTWIHLTFVKHSDDEYISLYVNGSRSGTDSAGVSGSGLNDTLCIGNTRNAAYCWWGNIDNVSYYPRALSSSEVSDIYSNWTTAYYLCEETPEIVHRKVSDEILMYVEYFTELIIDSAEIPPLLEFGLYASLGPEDYDGVCPPGESRLTDCDCAKNNFSLAPLSKILNHDDYATTYYIDHTDASSLATGTEAEPFNSWDDYWPMQAGTAYRFKNGTTTTSSVQREITANNVLLGSYGSGSMAKIEFTENTWGFIFQNVNAQPTKMITIRDLSMTAPVQYASGDANNPGRQRSASTVEFWGNVSADIYNCEFSYSGFGIRCGPSPVDYSFNKKLRVIGCNVHHTRTEGLYGFTEYIDVGFTSFTNINQLGLTQPEIHYQGVSNTGSTGDVIEADFKQMWVHNSILDHGDTPNKACIMQSGSQMVVERVILDYNIFVAPKLGSTSVQTLNGKFSKINGCLFFESPLNNKQTTCIWSLQGPDSIFHSVFVGFLDGIYMNYNTQNVYAHNVFYNNTYAIRSNTSKTFSTLRNTILYNNTYNLLNVTPSVNSNNLYTNPNFVNPTLSPYTADFSVQSGSAAINAGITLPYIHFDILGTEIPQEASPDIGAYERVP